MRIERSALAVAGIALAVAATAGASTSFRSADELPRYEIHAKFEPAKEATRYWIEPSDADRRRLGVDWRLVIPAAPFDPPPAAIDKPCTKTSPGKDRFEFLWRHGEEAAGGGCKHALEGRRGHQGIVHVVMVNKFGRCEAFYVGSGGGRGPEPKCTKEAARPDCSELEDRLTEVRAEIAALTDSLTRLDAASRATEARIKKAKAYIHDDLTQKIKDDPDVKPFVEKAEAELKAAEKEFAEAEAGFASLKKTLATLTASEAALEEKLKACLKGKRVAPKCTSERRALASAVGRAAGYRAVVRTYRRADLTGASGDLRDASRQLRSARAKADTASTRALLISAGAALDGGASALGRAAATISSSRRKAADAVRAGANARAALAACKKR